MYSHGGACSASAGNRGVRGVRERGGVAVARDRLVVVEKEVKIGLKSSLLHRWSRSGVYGHDSSWCE